MQATKCFWSTVKGPIGCFPRITSKIPKRHPFHHECMKSLQLVFRDPSDQGSVRTKPTPKPEILHKQLCRFKEMWGNVEYHGKQILPPAVVKEIHLVHIDRGCHLY